MTNSWTAKIGAKQNSGSAASSPCLVQTLRMVYRLLCKQFLDFGVRERMRALACPRRRPRSRGGSAVHWRPPSRPRPRLLQLRGEPEERRLGAEGRGELHPDRHILLVPV